MPVGVEVNQLGNAAHATGGEIGGNEEETHAQGLEQGAEGDEREVSQGGVEFFHGRGSEK